MINFDKKIAQVYVKEYQEKLSKAHEARGHDQYHLVMQELQDNIIAIYITASSFFKEKIEAKDEEALAELTHIRKEVYKSNLHLNREKNFVMMFVTNNNLISFEDVSKVFYNLEGTIMSVDHDFRIVSDHINTEGLQEHLSEAAKNIKKGYVEIARVKVHQATKGRVRVDLTIFTRDQSTSGTVCLTNSEQINNKMFDFDVHLPKVFNAPLVDILEYTTLLQDSAREYLTQESQC